MACVLYRRGDRLYRATLQQDHIVSSTLSGAALFVDEAEAVAAATGRWEGSIVLTLQEAALRELVIAIRRDENRGRGE